VNEGDEMSKFSKATAKTMIKKCPRCEMSFDLRFEESALEWKQGHECDQEIRAFNEWLLANSDWIKAELAAKKGGRNGK
jgi:predicted adenine nucleotide alpha hydrolase (AANH) superfamily ATPase